MKTIIVGIIQARMGSTRFPGKMKARLGGIPLIEWVIRRTKQSALLDKIVLATSRATENDYLEEVALKWGVDVFRGDENNILSRFISVVAKTNADIVVRICGDNPFICAPEIDRVVQLYLDQRPDYAFNHIPCLYNNYIDGLGAEVLSSELLLNIEKSTNDPRHLEHVTIYLWDNFADYKIATLKAPEQYSHPEIILDVNTQDDLLYLENHLLDSSERDIKPESYDVSALINKIISHRDKSIAR